MGEQQPKSNQQAFYELTQYAMGEEPRERGFGEGAQQIRDNIVNRVRKFRDKAGGIMKFGLEYDGPEYLPTEHEDYQYVYNYVRNFFNDPESDEILEDLLVEYSRRLKTAPNGENFAQRIPAMVYGQRPRQGESSDESLYTCTGRGGEKRLLLGVRPIQAVTLRTYLRPRNGTDAS